MSTLAMLGVTTFLSLASASLSAPADHASAEPLVEQAMQEQKQEDPPYDDARQQKLLAQWQEKQQDKWSSLPTESFTINASAYTAAADECGKSDGITASGVKVEEQRTLACPPVYPFGVKIAIDGYGVFVCEDRGGAIKGNKFDIYMETKKEAFTFGRRHLIAHVVE